MSCFDNYIELDDLIPSRSGLYVDSLPGIDIEMIDGLRKNAENSTDTWSRVYKRACSNLVSDVSKTAQTKFNVDSKVVSRETSEFQDTFNSAGVAGVKLTYNLSKYTKLHVISVSLWSATTYTAVIKFYDTDATGELLKTVTQVVISGRNTINVDYDFEVDELFISINTALFNVRKTENKFYHGLNWLSDFLCDFEWAGGTGSVEQINGGGLDVKYTVYCSLEKFVCENINLFKTALWWRLGVEITNERRYSERLNRFTTINGERNDELQTYYKDQYAMELDNSMKSQNIPEDMVCFNCKKTVYTRTSLP